MESTQEIWTIPAGRPPLGILPNFDNPASNGHMYVGVGTIGMLLMITFVLLRLYAKVHLLKNAGWDDAALVLAAVGRTSVTSLIFYVIQHGVGRHMWDVRLIDLPRLQKYNIAINYVDTPAYFFTKLSLLLLYFRLFSPAKLFKYLILAGIATCFLAYTTCMLSYIFLDPLLLLKVNYATGAFNVFSDLYILFLPIVAVSQLQLPKAKKLGVMLIFLSGGLACIMSILALIYRATFDDGLDTDLTWRLIPPYTVSTIEGDVGIMCACMPFFPVLVKQSCLPQHFFTSIKFMRSRVFRSKSTDESRSSSQMSDPKYLRAKEHYMELGEVREIPSNCVRIKGPKTFRTEFEGP